MGIKGKLCCPKCQGRIGSFDLPARKLCPCEQFMLPAVHVLCSRVDKITVTGNQGKLPKNYFTHSVKVYRFVNRLLVC